MCVVDRLWQRTVTACFLVCVLGQMAHPNCKRGFTDSSFSGTAVRQELVTGGVGLAPNDGNLHFLTLSKLMRFFNEIMVKPL